MLARVKHGVVLDCQSDNVVSGLRKPENRKVIGFGAAAGEDYLRRPAPQKIRNRLARTLDG